MKKGDIVVCVEVPNGVFDITVGKQYIISTIYVDVFTSQSDVIRIIDDDGFYIKFSKTYFKTLEEYRENKLNELGL